jgi:hypothetical protein
MFCPKCATQNLEGASFCRTCGANISLVPQAMTGQVPQPASEDYSPEGRERRKHGKELSLDRAFKKIFMGFAFLIIAIALSRSIGNGWWYWMLIPAFSMMGNGVAQYIRFRERAKTSSFAAAQATRTFPAGSNPEQAATLAAPRTGQLVAPPPSITEGTTRHLGVEAPTRHLDVSGDPK